MSDRPRDGISVYLAAHDAADARAIFDKCMELAATGEHYTGQLVFADPPRGCAQLHTRLPRTTTDRETGPR